MRVVGFEVADADLDGCKQEARQRVPVYDVAEAPVA
jgi:hypothetical protein